MTMRNDFNQIDARFSALSYDEVMTLVERGRKMRSRAMHDYMIGLGGLLRRAFERRGGRADRRHQDRRQPLEAKHA